MPTRRQTLGALGGALLGGGVVLTSGTESASGATVAFSVSDARYEADDGEVYAPWLDLSVGYAYTTNAAPQSVRAMVSAGPDDELLAMDSANVSTTSGEGSIPLHAKLTEADAYATGDFSVATPGDSVTVDVPVTVTLQVRGADGTLVSDTASKTLAVTVFHSGTVKEASVTVSGEVKFQDDEGDAKPV